MKLHFRLHLLVLVFIFSITENSNAQDIQLNNWKFQKGDNPNFAKQLFDDTNWENIKTGMSWEYQGHKEYDGFAWYRVHFILPENFKNSSYFKDTIQLIIGRVDDGDETYLNGERVGVNGRIILANDSIKFEKEINWWTDRNYKLSVNDKRLLWGKENVIAVRVHDNGGEGGLYKGIAKVTMRGVKDYVISDLNCKPIEKNVDGNYTGYVSLSNKSGFTDFSGKLTVSILNCETNLSISQKEFSVSLSKYDSLIYSYPIPHFDANRNKVVVQYADERSGSKIIQSKDLPYILTPKTLATPLIHTPDIFGAGPGKPFLYKIPTTGLKPITYSAIGLPNGLMLDASSGVISGNVYNKGTYLVELKAVNALGENSRILKIVIENNKLCLTPPMGWNSWNCWGLSVDELKIKSTTDLLVSSGLADHGWAYVNIDDGWQASNRTKEGKIQANEKFGDMKKLSDYVHSKGLKLGIYSSPGSTTCGGYLGSYQHELGDAQTYSEWGIDFLKYDWCSYSEVVTKPKGDDYLVPYRVMNKALNSTKRDIVYSICQYGMNDVSSWGSKVGGQLWRTTGDINDSWQSLTNIGFTQDSHASFAKSGGWNDPDMLVVGWVGWGPQLHPSLLTPNEQYLHVSLWSLLSAPLLIGCDLSRLDDFTSNLLTNDEVIAINQDQLGKQAMMIAGNEKYKIYSKQLKDGSMAVGLFNLDENDSEISVDWNQLEITGKHIVRDIWRQNNLGEFEGKFTSKVPAHGSVLIKVFN